MSRSAQEIERDDHIGLERLIFFSDAVFAIAITLLALDIRLDLPEGASNSQVLTDLAGLLPRILSFVLSFVVIGLIWIGHHRLFRSIVRYDRILMLLNLLELLFIAFLPFPTSLLSSGNSIVLALYSVTLTCTGLATALIWWYVTGDTTHLLRDDLDPHHLRKAFVEFLLQPALFVVSALVALLWGTWVWLLWSGILALAIFDTIASTNHPHGAVGMILRRSR